MITLIMDLYLPSKNLYKFLKQLNYYCFVISQYLLSILIYVMHQNDYLQKFHIPYPKY
jgi:hypothetical protein